LGDEFSEASKKTQSGDSSTLKAEATRPKGTRTRKRADRAARQDRKFARLAIEGARKSISENDGRPHPMVGAVLVKNGKVLAACHRGEIEGNHAEYLALEKVLADTSLVGATVYTTLEPCTTRSHPKVPCVERLIERKVARVVIGMLDPNPRITGQGQRRLRKANIVTDLFPPDLMSEVEELNREFSRAFDLSPGIPDSARPILKFRSASEFPRKQPGPRRLLGPTATGYNREYVTALEGRVNDLTSQLRSALSSLEKSYDYTLEVLGDALDLTGVNQPGHTRRVTGYTILIARAMAISKPVIAVIARGAFLHSVSRLGVPDSILKKRQPPNAEEMAILREHCVRGYRMLKRIPVLKDAAEIVYAQYECFDGSGYPRGLKGEEIPLGARIFQVANAFDMFTSDGPFRGYESVDDASNRIDKLSGKQCDPEIVSVFHAMPRKLWIDLRREINRSMDK